jgi:hypothetical protein
VLLGPAGNASNLIHGVGGIERAGLSFGPFEKVKLYKSWHLVELAVTRRPNLLESCLGPFGYSETVPCDKHNSATDPCSINEANKSDPRYLSRAQGKKSETRYKIGDFGRACRCSLFLCLQLALIVRRKRLGQDWPAAGVVRGSEAIDDGRPSATLVAQAFENLPEPGPSQI